MIEFLIHIHVNGNSSVGKVKNSKSSKKSCNPSVTDKRTEINQGVREGTMDRIFNL